MPLKFKRGTRAQVDAAAVAGSLVAGQPYLITDEGRMAIGLSANAYRVEGAVCLINGQTGTSYTLALPDGGKAVELTNAAAIALVVPTNSAVPFPIGVLIPVVQGGAGQFTVTPFDGTVTIKKPYTLTSAKQEATMFLHKVALNTWRVSGDST